MYYLSRRRKTKKNSICDLIIAVVFFSLVKRCQSADVTILYEDTNRQCAANDFHCPDGPCIDQRAVCNGFHDCPKGDDETKERCSEAVNVGASMTPCPLPPRSPDRVYKIQCPSEIKLCYSIRDGEAVKFSHLYIECNAGFIPEEQFSSLSTCLANGTWYPEILRCKKICDPTPAYLNLKCKQHIRNQYIPCPTVLSEGIIVTPQCKPGYEYSSDYRDRYITCLEDGTWDRDFPLCSPICGKFRETINLIAYGTPTNSTPWNVALYRTDRGLICGGTLLARNLVLTAAHCVYSDQQKKPYDENLFEIVAGKYTSDIRVRDFEWTQKLKVRQIFMPGNPEYTGGPQFSADLAILWLNDDVTLNDEVLPACVHWTDVPPFEPSYRESKLGNVTGFGLTEKNISPNVSLTASLPYISQSTCQHRFSQYRLAIDKFCAGYEQGPGALSGDSGSGLVFQDRYDGFYYLRGVVSFRPGNSPSFIAVFTDISHHIKWISTTRMAIELQDTNVLTTLPGPSTNINSTLLPIGSTPPIQTAPPKPPIQTTPPVRASPPSPTTPRAPATSPVSGTPSAPATPPAASTCPAGSVRCSGEADSSAVIFPARPLGPKKSKPTKTTENLFRCKDGSFIERHMLCDGARNCLDGSDELFDVCVKIIPCPANRSFVCDYGACIPSAKACDGKKDCADGSDETRSVCSNEICKSSQISCKYGACIVDWYECDGKYDCVDGSDEQPLTCSKKKCLQSEFQCHYGGCVRTGVMCDGKKDCVDGSDEMPKYCDKMRSPRCLQSMGKFECNNDQCIKLDKMCDGRVDCDDGSDETRQLCRASLCSGKKVKCGSGGCIHANYLCDGQKDCALGDDEEVSYCNNITRKYCTKQQFPCNFNTCIPYTLLCDGKADCLNGKDETTDLCKNRKMSTYSTETHFRCEYGGYVLKNKECDGTKDCIDGSDEDPVNCSRRQCAKSQFRCAYGACINIHDNVLCNGRNDCVDGSDEDPKFCKDFACLPNEIKCGDGTCIAGTLRCNNIKDCANGSDEENCIKLTLYYTTFFPGIESLVYRCPYPANSSSQRYNYSCEGIDNDCYSTFENRFKNQSTLFVACNPGYASDEATKYRGICDYISREWKPRVPYCHRICDTVPSHLDYGCRQGKNSSEIPCTGFMRPGAVIAPRCKPYYHAESLFRDRYVTCLEDGTWDRDFFLCSPDCGRFDDNLTDSTPWNVVINRSIGAGRTPIVCGGTLLTVDAIITSAGCVRSSQNEAINASAFEVLIGRAAQNVTETNFTWTQKFEVKKVFLPDPQKPGQPGREQANLAILWLRTKVQLAANALPACVQWKDDQRFEPSKSDNRLGQLTGFGLHTNGSALNTLHTVPARYLNAAECRQKVVNNNFRRNFFDDMFCANNEDGSRSTFGDSGAGLLFQDRYDKLYYLRGVVSHEETTATSSIIAFTDIALHVSWINKVINETRQSS